MAKYFKLSAEQVEQCVSEFRALIDGAKLPEGKLSFSKDFGNVDGKAKIVFSPIAYAKTVAIVSQFSKEVAWHGFVRRSEEEDSTFYIDDIVVYPQEVTGATVTTDQVEYTNWLNSLDDDHFNSLRLQAHSHVNMATSPSSVDTNGQDKIIDQMEGDMFYIFMIFNKSFNNWYKIYDLKNNIVYNTSDIRVTIDGCGASVEEFIGNAKEIVKEKTYTTTSKAGSVGATTTQKSSVEESPVNHTGYYGSAYSSQYYGGGAKKKEEKKVVEYNPQHYIYGMSNDDYDGWGE